MSSLTSSVTEFLIEFWILSCSYHLSIIRVCADYAIVGFFLKSCSINMYIVKHSHRNLLNLCCFVCIYSSFVHLHNAATFFYIVLFMCSTGAVWNLGRICVVHFVRRRSKFPNTQWLWEYCDCMVLHPITHDKGCKKRTYNWRGGQGGDM